MNDLRLFKLSFFNFALSINFIEQNKHKYY